MEQGELEYEAFVDKFKPKKTTDDCYTPPDVYDTVLQWVSDEYGIQGRPVVRPFWPGGDYQHETYPAECVVIDNPPFSILSKICRWYLEHDIDFFLFAPYLTNFSADLPVNHIITDTTITYHKARRSRPRSSPHWATISFAPPPACHRRSTPCRTRTSPRHCRHTNTRARCSPSAGSASSTITASTCASRAARWLASAGSTAKKQPAKASSATGSS